MKTLIFIISSMVVGFVHAADVQIDAKDLNTARVLQIILQDSVAMQALSAVDFNSMQVAVSEDAFVANPKTNYEFSFSSKNPKVDAKGAALPDCTTFARAVVEKSTAFAIVTVTKVVTSCPTQAFGSGVAL